MLNRNFSKKNIDLDNDNFIIRGKLKDITLNQNKNFNTGPEKRLSSFYSKDIWNKLNNIGITKNDFDNKVILDVACGAGFLSYHLLKFIKPKKIILFDISQHELNEAKKLLSEKFKEIDVEYVLGDAMNMKFKNNYFDIVIGNSFLHHFYNIPKALNEFNRVLSLGGIFITLHEPTPAAMFLETRHPKYFFSFLKYGDKYIDFYRNPGPQLLSGSATDIWMLEPEKIYNLLLKIGFEDIRIDFYNLIRPKIIVFLKIFNRRKLNILYKALLNISVAIDSLLKKIIPKKYFGSICILSRK